MKRAPELVPLSHDHHQALSVALQLKRAEDRTPAEAFLDFFESDGTEHFRIEEEVLLPTWLAADPQADRMLAQRVAAEHLEIRTRALRLRDPTTAVDDLRALGELLEAHVRFEERELFPLIESGLDQRAIARLQADSAGR